MVNLSSLSAAVATALLVSSASAFEQKLYGLNYDLRQGADWDPKKCKDSDAIEADLKILSTITSNIRIYSLSDCDVSGVLTTAKKLSLTVWLGVWVSEDSKVYDAEVVAFKKLISAGLIDSNIVGINVGSEAVYRKDITAAQAIKYVTDFRKVMAANKVSVPVSITDIVDTFVQYPDMLKAGDIVTINQFPYWEKMKAEKAVAQFNNRIKPLIKMAGKMEVIISETGWPTDGTAVNGSVASPENAANYLNDFYELAESQKWKYYYFAGFDTPYKAQQAADNATVESHFGIFDKSGTMKPAYKSLTFTKNDDVTLLGSSSNDTLDSSYTSDGAGTVTAGKDKSSGATSDPKSSSGKDKSSSSKTSAGVSHLVVASISALACAASAIILSL